MAVLSFPTSLEDSASLPSAVFWLPVEFTCMARPPTAVLEWPVLLKNSALNPTAVLEEPVLFASAPNPRARLKEPVSCRNNAPFSASAILPAPGEKMPVSGLEVNLKAGAAVDPSATAVDPGIPCGPRRPRGPVAPLAPLAANTTQSGAEVPGVAL